MLNFIAFDLNFDQHNDFLDCNNIIIIKVVSYFPLQILHAKPSDMHMSNKQVHNPKKKK